MTSIEHAILAKRRSGEVDPVYSLKEAAEIAHQCPDTLKARAKKDKLKLVRLAANRLGIRASELERYLKSLETVA